MTDDCTPIPCARSALLTSLLAGILLAAGCGKEPQPAPAPAPVPTPASDPIELGVEALDEAGYRRHVETLASDAFGGRAPGSPGTSCV
jgi:uncharacterized lipoprotein YajG